MCVKAGAIDESTAVLLPLDESAEGDDPNKVTVKHLEFFDAKSLQIPKQPREGNDEIIKRLRLDTEDDHILKLSTEKQSGYRKAASKR